jgi:hypothetical protein
MKCYACVGKGEIMQYLKTIKIEKGNDIFYAIQEFESLDNWTLYVSRVNNQVDLENIGFNFKEIEIEIEIDKYLEADL